MTTLQYRRALVAVLALGAMWRTLYAGQYAGLPFLDAPLFDSEVYLAQADAVLRGRYGDPTLLAFSPLYGYFLALTGGWAVPLQFILGLCNAGLVAVTARELVRLSEGGDRIARCASLAGASLYFAAGLPMFYESKILSETLGQSLLLLGLWLFLRGIRRGAAGLLVSSGVAFAFATLARANLLFTLPFWPVAIVFAPKGSGLGTALRSRALGALLVALGILAPLGLHGAWNLSNTGHFVPVIMVSKTVNSTTSGSFDGNLRASDGGTAPPSPWDVVDQATLRLQGNAQEQPLAIDWLGYIKGAPEKALRTFRDDETTFQYGYYGERSELWALNATPLSFGALLALALLSLMRARLRRTALLLAPIVLGVLATTTLFHPSSRYRYALFAVLVPLAALGCVEAARVCRRWWRERSRERKPVGWALPVVIGALALAVTLSVRTVGYELRHPGMWELRVAESELRRGAKKQAEMRITRALDLGSDDPAVRRRVAMLQRMFPSAFTRE